MFNKNRANKKSQESLEFFEKRSIFDKNLIKNNKKSEPVSF